MKTEIRRFIRKFGGGQRGSAMILVLIFMALAGLTVIPMLDYMSTGLKTGAVFEETTQRLYAAESGVSDALWYVTYSSMDTLFGVAYKDYDFNMAWTYTVNQTVNDHEVDVSIRNVWMPENVVTPLEPNARSIIEDGKLLVTSSANNTSTYQIEAVYYPNAGDELNVETIGIWLPPGFDYVPGSSNLEQGDPADPYYPVSVQDIPWASGRAIIWQLASVPFDQCGPDVDSEHLPMVVVITFNYTADKAGTLPSGVAWMTTSGDPDVPYTWDADVKVYKIQSTAGDQSVEAYATRSEMRQLGAAVKGDYYAVGNVLETATGDENYRNRLLKESTATVSNDNIPAAATIRDAWLYWSGWIGDGHQTQVWSDDCSALSSWQSIWSDDCSALTSWQTLWQDSCNNFSNWSAGSAWSVYGSYGNYRFRAHYSSGGDTARTLTLSSGIDLEAYHGQTVTISWDQTVGGSLYSSDGLRFSIYNGSTWSSWMDAFHGGYPASPFSYTIPDSYLNPNFKVRFYVDGMSGYNDYVYLDNITISAANGGWNTGSDWSVYSYYGTTEFRGYHATGHTEDDRYLEMSSAVDLSGYTGEMVRLSWDQSEGSNLESSDGLEFYIYDGSAWQGPFEAFHHGSRTSPFSYTIPQEYLTSGFKLKFYLDDMSGSGEYAAIDNIDISYSTGGWSSGADWDIYSSYGNSEFRGHHYSGHTEDDRYLTMGGPVDLSAYYGKMVTVSWDQDESGNLGSSDGLKFAVYNDSGWSALMTAFHGNNPSSPYSYTIPNAYLTSDFKIKFYLDGMSGSDYSGNYYAYIDNIVISAKDMGVDRVMFNGHEITANKQQFNENLYEGTPVGWSYSCSYDATDLVKQMIDEGDLQANGAGIYTVGHVMEPREGDPGYSYNVYSLDGTPLGATGYPLAIPSSEFSYGDIRGQYTYAGWSLILIYTSPETAGHQLYLYDDFLFAEHYDVLDMPVSGFLAPSDTTGSKATFFVGEGDASIGGLHYGPDDKDGVRINGYDLSDAENPADNVWNSYSNALDNPEINGIDLDTFDISSHIQPEDTSADIQLHTYYDGFAVIYVILSFRSDSQFGGVISFQIND
jgi:hypothetical protein